MEGQICPICHADLERDLRDILRKSDESRFECPECYSNLKARKIVTIVVEVDIE